MKYIIYDPKTELHKMFIDSLCFELEKLNHIYLIINKIDAIDINYINNEKTIIVIILNPHFLKDDELIKSTIKYISSKFKLKILYITEPLNLLIEKKVYEEFIRLLKPFHLWTYTFENFNKLNIHTPIFRVHPICNETYNLCSINPENLKNRNTKQIIFFGNINENRQNIIKANFNNQEDLIINIKDDWSKSKWENILDKNLFYLNIHRRQNCKSFESFRIFPILYNGGVIISSRCNKREEEEFKEYNIIFVDDNELLLNKYQELLHNIDYEKIYEKTINFRNRKSNLSMILI